VGVKAGRARDADATIAASPQAVDKAVDRLLLIGLESLLIGGAMRSTPRLEIRVCSGAKRL
jgi:hypothetical protein